MKLIRITIEGMHNVAKKVYDLSNLTYLHGPNGAGKSTVMQAIQLALLGYIPGTSKASKGAIFEHANGHVLAVTLDIDNDGELITVSRVWSGTKSNITAALDISPEGYNIESIIKDIELPIFNFNEFIDMTANKLKDWFINFLPSSDLSIDWVKVLTEDAIKAGFDPNCGGYDDDYRLEDLVNQEVNYIQSLELTGSDLVRAVNTRFKDILSFKKKEAERAQSTIQSLIFYDDIDTSVSLSDIETNIKVYESAKLDRADYARKAQRNNTIKMQLKDYDDCNASTYEADDRYIEASKKYTEAVDTICKYQADVIELQTAIEDIRKDLLELTKQEGEISVTIKTKNEIIHSEGICPFTKLKCDSVQPLIKEYSDSVAVLTKELDNVRKSYFDCKAQMEETEIEIKNIQNKIKELEVLKSDCLSTQSSLQYRYETKHRLKSEIVIVPELDEVDYDSKIKELRDIQVKYEANKKYNELIDTLTANKFKVDQEVNVYKSWVNLTGVNGLQNSSDALQPFINLGTGMDTYLQAVFGNDIYARFNLEAKANSFSFGIERDRTYIPYNLLSSGEKCMYTLALMMSLVKVSESPLKLIMIDDLLDHLDDININKLFDSLSEVNDIQMIFAGVKLVEHKDILVEVTK